MNTVAPFNVTADADDAQRAELQQVAEQPNGTSAPKVFDEETGDLVDALTFARRALRLPELGRLVKYSEEEPTFDIELTDGRRFPVGGTPQLRKPEVVTDIIADATNRYPPAFSGKEFRPIANALRALAELEDAGASPKHQTRFWVAQFCDAKMAGVLDLTEDNDRKAAVTALEAFTSKPDGHVYLHAPSMHDRLRTMFHVRISLTELTAQLARLGFANETITAPRAKESKDGKQRQRQRRYWRSPADYDWRADL
jgi:hypothetical protein